MVVQEEREAELSNPRERGKQHPHGAHGSDALMALMGGIGRTTPTHCTSEPPEISAKLTDCPSHLPASTEQGPGAGVGLRSTGREGSAFSSHPQSPAGPVPAGPGRGRGGRLAAPLTTRTERQCCVGPPHARGANRAAGGLRGKQQAGEVGTGALSRLGRLHHFPPVVLQGGFIVYRLGGKERGREGGWPRHARHCVGRPASRSCAQLQGAGICGVWESPGGRADPALAPAALAGPAKS